MIGTTGAGKTTIVRQLLGTDPDSERFPSTSAAKTTICDIEIILRHGTFEVVVAFMPKDQVRQYIADCVSSAASRHIQRAGRAEVARRFLEHTDQQFRLSYVLGTPSRSGHGGEELLDDDDAELLETPDESLLTDEERQAAASRIEQHLDTIETIGDSISAEVEKVIGSKSDELTPKDMDAFEELVEEGVAPARRVSPAG
ncbi:MAG: hypothetical protein IPJ41_16360 [Phycisphaerales bacterium]|nr:hypothetical protein [Phycisphaerales bacterium]